MKPTPLIRVLLASVLIAFGASADAKTLRFSSQGDITTIDPHGNNEGFTNAFLDNIYEPLVTRGKDLKVEPALAVSWQQVNPTTMRFKLRPNVKFQDGTPFTADDVVFSITARALRHFELQALPRRRQGGEGGRSADGGHRHRRARADADPAAHRSAHHEQGMVDQAQRHQAAGLQGQGRDLRLAQRQRHRPLHPEEPRGRREDGGGEELQLVGQARRQRRRDRLPADQVRRHAAGRAALRRDRLRRSTLRRRMCRA